MRRLQNDNTSTSQATRNLATNPEFVADVSDKLLYTNLITNPSFETSGSTVNVRTNLVTNPSFETAGSLFTTRTNLATNPSMEAAGSAGAVGTNLATNPSMEATSGTVYTRTNLCPNPSFEVDTASWLPNTGAPTLSASTDKAWSGTKSLKMVSTQASADIASFFAVTLTASTTYTLSYYVFSPDARTSYFDAAATNYNLSNAGSTSVPANTWTRVSATFTTSSNISGSTTFYLHNSGGPTTIGTALYIDAVLLEQTSLLQPYFDGSAPIQNLCTNPSFDTDASGWTGKGSTIPTFATDTTRFFVGTKSLKITWTSDTVTQGVGFNVSGLIVGKKYTMSGYVYIPTGNLDVISTVASIGYGNQISTRDVWSRSVMTFVATATTHNIGFDSVGFAQIGKTFYLDAVMLTDTSTVLEYFSGTGDFTYGWTGTANASTSVQQAPGVTSFGANNNGSVIWSSTTLAYVGTKSLACKSTGLNANNGTSIYVPPLTANTTYTLSAWVYLPSAYGAGVSVAAGGSSFTLIRGNVVSTVGAWTRTSVTFTTGATGPFDAYAYVITGGGDTPAAGATFYVDGWLLEAGAVLNLYYDGATAAAGDFTYAWSGTANASTSYKLAPSVTGWQPRWFGSGSAGVTYQSKSGMNGGNCIRKLWLTSNGSPQDSGINATSPYVPVTAGTVYTASIYFRSSVAQHMSIYIQWFDAGLASLGFSPSATDLGIASANTWTRFSVSGTAPANATSASFIFGPYTNASAVTAGTTMDYDQCLIEASPVLNQYFDGSNPIQNRHANPSLESNSSDWNFWTGATGAATGTRQTTGGWIGTGFWRVAWTSSQTGQYHQGGGYTDALVTPGLAYSASIKVKANRGQVLRMSMEWVNAAKDTQVATATVGPDVTVSANVWTEIKMENIVVPANTAYLRITVYQAPTGTQWLVGDTLDLDAAFVILGTTVGPYFEGSGDYTYSWSGTANASTSLQKAMSVVGVTAPAYLCNAFQSSYGATNGSKSVRIIATSTSNDSFAEFNNMLSGYTFKANTTYTLAADRTLTAPLVSPSNLARVNVGSELSITNKVAPVNAAGTSRMVLQFTTGATTNLAFIRLYLGTSNTGGEIWYDKLTLEEGITDGRYFDGVTPVYENLVKTTATALSTTNTTGISYGGSTWTRASVVTGTGMSITRQYVNLADLVQGATYTTAVTVANDQTVAQDVYLDWCDLGGTVYTIQPGETRRIKVTTSRSPYDSTYCFSDLQIQQDPAQTRSILYKDWLIEKGTTAGDYYAGTGDFTYVWNGTAHASTSYARADTVTNASYGSAWAIRSTEWSSTSGTKSLRLIPNLTASDTFSAIGGDTGAMRLGMVAGKTYTAKAKVRLSAPLTGSLQPNRYARMVLFTKVGAAAYVETTTPVPANVAGVTDVSMTFTLASDITEAFIRLYNGASYTNGDVWWDDFMLVEGPDNGAYFDGSTASAGDFTNAWTGTAHASTSTRRVMAVKGDWVGQRSIFYSSADQPFSGSAKVKGTVSALGYFPRILGTLSTPPVPGRRYTAFAKMKCSASPVQIAIVWIGSATPAPAGQAASNGNWVATTATGICPSDATGIQIYIGVTDNTPIGTDFEIDSLMVVDRGYDGPFCSGDTYGWVWEGTPNASISKGYPVGLMQLAGKPLFIQTTPGTYVLTDVNPANNPVLASNAPRTIYTIVNNILEVDTGNIDVAVTYGVDDLTDTVPNKTITIRQQSQTGVGTNTLLARRTGGSGPITNDVPALGRQILIGGLDENGNLFTAVNKSALTKDTGTVLSVPHERITIAANNSNHQHVATYIYRGVHSSAVRQEMVKLLAHEYNIPGM